ncbi:MAG: AmmeMemoRadiSam system protein B [Treponema sp.]|nr:AmmeMemoRadiSam system protein B [Treponema sp.]
MEIRERAGLKRRSSVVNGIFYPDSSETMKSRLASWGLKEGLSALGGQALLAPHGAWDLTGNIAASAFVSVQERGQGSGGLRGRSVSRVFLLGPHHQNAEEGIYLSESCSFETPLGDLMVDQKLNRKLASCATLIRVNDIPHLSEHCLEVLLPLVKYCFPKAKIVPILMAGRRPALISGLAKALWIVLEKHMEASLVIVSSNISRDPDPATARSMAHEFNGLLANMDTPAFLSRLNAGRISASGGALVGALLKSGLLEGRHFSSLLPLSQGKGEMGDTVYFGAFSDRPNSLKYGP